MGVQGCWGSGFNLVCPKGPKHLIVRVCISVPFLLLIFTVVDGKAPIEPPILNILPMHHAEERPLTGLAQARGVGARAVWSVISVEYPKVLTQKVQVIVQCILWGPK